jgi:DnaJ-class molecular chaperone
MSEEQKDVKRLADLPELEVRCERCEGRGEEDEVGTFRTYDCPECGGAGFVPTEFGQKVLAIVRHNLRITHGSMSWR